MRPARTHPHPRVIAVDTVTAGVMARASLSMAKRAIEKAREEATEWRYTHAQGLNHFATDCVITGLAAVGAGQQMAEGHEHDPDCLIEKCQVETGLSLLEKAQEQLEIVERETFDLGLSIDTKNRIAPLEDSAVHRHAEVIQYQVRLEELQEMTSALQTERDGPGLSTGRSARETDANIRVAEWICLAPNMCGLPEQMQLLKAQNPVGEEMHKEDSEEYTAQSEEAEAAQERMLNLLDPMVRKHTKDMPTLQSATVQRSQEMSRAGSVGPLWMTVPDTTLLYDNQAAAKLAHQEEHGYREEDEADSGKFLICTQFIHQGRRIEKTIQDPYPKDFPQDIALSHITSAREIALEIWAEVEELPQRGLDLVMMEISQAEARALNEFHTVSKKDLQRVMRAAQDRGASRGMTADMIEGMMTHDTRMARAVLQDDDRWMQTMTKEQVQSMVRHGRQIGVDEHTLRRMAIAMGYSEKEVGIQAPVLDNEAIKEIASEALEAGIPQDAVKHMEEWLRS
jgi:hypothetical protein